MSDDTQKMAGGEQIALNQLKLGAKKCLDECLIAVTEQIVLEEDVARLTKELLTAQEMFGRRQEKATNLFEAGLRLYELANVDLARFAHVMPRAIEEGLGLPRSASTNDAPDLNKASGRLVRMIQEEAKRQYEAKQAGR